MDRRLIAVIFAAFALTFTACNVAFGAVPDAPVESVSLVVKLWRSGAIPASLIVALFVGLRFASAKIAWLRKGHAALITTAALAGLAILAEPAAGGDAPNLAMIWSALATAIGVALNPVPKAPGIEGLPLSAAYPHLSPEEIKAAGAELGKRA